MAIPSLSAQRRPEADSSRLVLVVEDDAVVARFLEALLTNRGYRVLVAGNSVQALVALTVPRPELPHAVILDLGLPLESGLSVLSFVRKVVGNELPVVVLTGHQDPEEETAVRKLGVSAFLRKPARGDQVLACLSAALR